MDEGLELAQYTMIDFRHGTKVTIIGNIVIQPLKFFTPPSAAPPPAVKQKQKASHFGVSLYLVYHMQE